MTRALPSLLLFFISLAIFLLATLPVRFGLKYLPKDIPIEIIGAQGTIWKGEASDIRWQNRSLGTLTWKLHILPFLTAKLTTDFTLRGNGLTTEGTASTTTHQVLQLTNTHLQADLATLPIPKAQLLVTPEGTLNAQIRHLEYANNLVQTADADFLWKPARITSPLKYDLGEIELLVTGENAELEGKLDSRDGPIHASGILKLNPQGMLSANIQLTPDASTPKELRDMLPLLGKPNQEGAIRLNQQIQIPNWPS